MLFSLFDVRVVVLAVLLAAQGRSAIVSEVPSWFEEVSDKLPRAQADRDGSVSFNIPAKIVRSLKKKPQSYLSGACKTIHKGYRDGERVSKLASKLGDDTVDFILEFIMFDFLSSPCGWVDHYWGDLIRGWKYVPRRNSEILQKIGRDFGYLTVEMQKWFGWWVKEQARVDNVLYEDGVYEWKTLVAEQFLSLKTVPEWVSDFPTESTCSTVNPVTHFADKWQRIVRFLKLWHVKDVSSASPSSPSDPSDPSDPSGPSAGSPKGSPKGSVVYQVNNEAVVCVGFCIRLGAGFTYDYHNNRVHVHWSYGVEDYVGVDSPTGTDANMQMSLRVHCQGLEDISDAYGPLLAFGSEEDNMQYHVLYTPQPEYDLQGFSFTVAIDGAFDEARGKDRFLFRLANTGPVARIRSDEYTTTAPPAHATKSSLFRFSRLYFVLPSLFFIVFGLCFWLSRFPRKNEYTELIEKNAVPETKEDYLVLA